MRNICTICLQYIGGKVGVELGENGILPPQAGPPDTLASRQLLSPTCHTAVAARLNGAGEREVETLEAACSACLLVSW
eukprot:scaffold58431_cov33-Phaeocystis_antarctica.AAC.1